MKSENIWKIQKKIVKWHGKYGRKVGWNVKWYGKYGRKVGWIVKWWKIWKTSKLKCEMIYLKNGRKASRIVIRYGKYGRKVS